MYFNYTTDENGFEVDPIFYFKLNLGYKVDSLVEVITKPMMDMLREMFEILDDIRITFPCNSFLPNRPSPWGSLFLHICFLLDSKFHFHH